VYYPVQYSTVPGTRYSTVLYTQYPVCEIKMLLLCSAGRALLLLVACVSPAAVSSFDGAFFAGDGDDTYLALVDAARRLLSAADPKAEFMTLTGVLDGTTNALTEGAQWAGNIWTQNTYGFGLTAAPFLDAAQRAWLQTSYNWWFDHRGDGGQKYGGLPDVPAGMLCDNGSPTGCNYMQCGPGRNAKLTRWSSTNATSKYQATLDAYEQKRRVNSSSSRVGDTEALGHDWIIEGSLAGVIMQAEMLLATRNITGARRMLPVFKELSDFLETRRVQDASALTPGSQGLFFAGNGANLLAPGFGGQPLPRGCLFNASCGKPGFGGCCQQRGFAYLAGLTVTYSGVLDRLISLEAMAWGRDARNCTRPNQNTDASVRSCSSLWKARRAANDASMSALVVNMTTSSADKYAGEKAEAPSPSLSQYLLKALSPDGEKLGEYAQRPACDITDKTCSPATRHGYFEASPNVDAIALGIVDAAMAGSFYASLQSLGARINPCGWTLPNFPAYDDACHDGTCFGYGTWVSGGSWSTLEGRVILAHLSQGRHDLAAASMQRLIYPYAQLFKMDNPIAYQGCGPGMYSQANSRGDTSGPLLDIDVFAIPSSFLRGTLGLVIGADALTLRPQLPASVTNLTSKAPIFWGGAELYVTFVRQAASKAGARSAMQHTNNNKVRLSVMLNGTVCGARCKASSDPSAILVLWDEKAYALGSATVVVVTIHQDDDGNASSSSNNNNNKGMSTVQYSATETQSRFRRDQAAWMHSNNGQDDTSCDLDPATAALVKNATGFRFRMEAAGLAATRFEYQQAGNFLSAMASSTARCKGRASGKILAMPAEPKAWEIANYSMVYNQTKTEEYFKAVPTRIWEGLLTTIRGYACRENATPREAAVVEIFRGTTKDVRKSIAARTKLQEIDSVIAVAEKRLAWLRVEKGRLRETVELMGEL
jgi:hypothetical protein